MARRGLIGLAFAMAWCSGRASAQPPPGGQYPISRTPAPPPPAVTPPAPPTGQTTPLRGPTCSDRVTELAEWLRDLDRVTDGVPVTLALADLAGPGDRFDFTAVSALPVIEVSAAGLSLRGQRLAPAEVAKQLEARRLIYGGQAGGALTLEIAPDAPFTQVAAAASAGRDAGFASAWLLFDRVVPAVPRPTSTIDAKLDAARLQAAGLSVLVGELFAPCHSAMGVLRQMAVSDPEQKLPVFVKRLPAALYGCDCRLDLDEVRAVAWTVVGLRSQVARKAVALPLADRHPRRLALPGRTLWSAAAPRVLAALAATPRPGLTLVAR